MKVLRYFRVISEILWEVDTITLRAVMACASLLFTASLMLSPQPFTKEAYSVMSWVAPQWAWAAIFAIYGLSTIKLVWDDVKNGLHRATWNRATNLYGFVIWGVYVLSVCLALEYFPPAMSMYVPMVILLGWAIVRTAPERRVR